MLRRLQIRNYVLIDSLDIEFPEGLVIITGQTGAGKSILLGALNLALGAKADASVIGEDGGNCVVEVDFYVENPAEAMLSLLQENDLEPEDGHIIVRRVVNPTGRSRSFINDSPVTVQVLSSLAAYLIDIHSQHQTLRLSEPAFRLSALDMFAGNGDLLSEYRAAFAEMGRLESELAAMSSRLEKARSEKEYNASRLAMLESASLKPGELESLEAEQKQLANAEEIKECLCGVESLYYGEASGESVGVDSMLKSMERYLERASKYIPAAAGLAERLSSCRVETDDIVSEVSSVNSATDVSQERLQSVEDRISFLYGLMQKFGCRTVGELLAERDRLDALVSDTSGMEDKVRALSDAVATAGDTVRKLAESLHASREKSAASFASSIQDSVRYLELPYAVFEVQVCQAPLSQSGNDSVSFLFSASGKNPVDVSRCASGGELSRIMLSLKAMMARYMDMPTMIFDEIDTGVSGSVADRMGSMICDMGHDMQVFAITHLPQVAAKGDAHYLVSKEIDPASGNAVSSITRLSPEGRVMEVARMLSGSVLTDAAIENAKSLLQSSSLTL